MRKIIVSILTIFMVCFCILPTQAANRETDVKVPANGNSFVVINGTYYSETKEKVLKRINAIRKEACDKGYINPSTGEKLKKSDYKAIKWSYDLECIAQIRAAEASVYLSHVRPNGTMCFSCTHNGISSWGEVLAWNWSGMSEAIEQWYSEKNTWVKQTEGITGHYTQMIDPNNNYIGLGTFECSNGGWIATAGEFSFENHLDETKSNLKGKYSQLIEVPNKTITSLKVSNTSLYKGKSKQLVLSTQIKFGDEYNSSFNATIPNDDITWSSSNSSIATVNKNGTVSAKNYGTATIKAIYKGKTYTSKVSVIKTDVKNLSYSKITNKTYTGKQIKPGITIKNGKTTLKNGKDYKITYGKNKNTGKATITVKGIGEYTGSKTINFYIVPKAVSISSVKSTSRSKATVKYKKVTGASGYQIAYLKQGTKTWKYTTTTSLSKTLTKLTRNKKYYVKVRAYKTVGKTKYYGNFSKQKTVKIK